MKNLLTYFIFSYTLCISNAFSDTTGSTLNPVSVSPFSASAGTIFTFTATLDKAISNREKVKINLGMGLTSMTGSGTKYKLSRSIYKIGSQDYTVGVYNNKGALQKQIGYGYYTVTGNNSTPSSIFISPPSTRYSKIGNNGYILPNTAIIGHGDTDWACNKDNETGLIWEIKTSDNIDSVYTLNQIDGVVAFVNQQGLCGAQDWRMPTSEELYGLIECRDGVNNGTNNQYLQNYYLHNTRCRASKISSILPTIDYAFPDLFNSPIGKDWLFWSSSGKYADFLNGIVTSPLEGGSKFNIRLVRKQQVF